MVSKIILKIIFLFFILILIFFTSSFLLNKRVKKSPTINKIQKEKQINPSQKQSTDKHLFPQNASIKNTISNMYFSYQLESISKERKLLIIYLKGSDNSLADAADLRLNFDKNITIEKINEGDSFVYYPRKIIKDNYLLITGVSLDETKSFKPALPNTVFIKLLVKINDSKSPSLIRVDQENTQIFFEGKNITNFNNSFAEIRLN